MGFLKSFFFEHGEKVFLGLVAVWALWNMGSNLFRAKNQIRLTDGTSFVLKPEQLQAQISHIKTHVADESTAVLPALPEPFRSTTIAAGIQGVYSAENWRAQGWDSFYIRPPRRGNREKVTIIPTIKEYPPAEYRPNIGAPADVAIRAGGSRMVLTFSDSPETKYVTGVRAMVWRCHYGYAKSGMDAAAFAEALTARDAAAGTAPAKLPTKSATPEPAADPAKFDLNKLLKPEGAPPVPTPEAKAPTPEVTPGDMDANSPDAGTDRVDSRRRLREQVDAAAKEFAEQERATTEQLLKALDPHSIKKEMKWELVADSIAGSFDAPDVEQLLTGASAPAPDDDATDGSYRQRHYVFIDNKLEENAIYRYRIAFRATALDLPEAVRAPDPNSLTKRPKYNTYQPLLRFDEYRQAMPLPAWKAVLDAKDVLAGAVDIADRIRKLTWQPECTLLQRYDSRDASQQPLRWWELAEEHPASSNPELRRQLAQLPGCTAFSFSPYALTPIRTIITYRSSFSENTVSCEVTLIDDKGERQKAQFMVQVPKPSEPINYALPPDKRYEKVTPVPIGGLAKTGTGVTKTEFDFSTGWGLVDIRECTVVKTQVTRTVKQDEKGKPVIGPDGKEVVVVTPRGMPFEMKYNYLVLRELKKENPRYMPKQLFSVEQDQNNPNYEIQVKYNQ